MDVFHKTLMQEMETLWKEGIDILEPLYLSPSMITRYCLLCLNILKVGWDVRCAWMAPYGLSWKLASWWKDIGTEVISSIVLLMASLNYILLQYEGMSIMFSIWSGPSRSLMG